MGMTTPPMPIRIPRTVTCDNCGKPFETIGDETTCTQCMIKPSRRPTDFPPVPKEMIMSDFSNTIRKKKVCVDCTKEFIPSGNCQKRCPECAAKITSGTHPKMAKARTSHPFGKDIAAAPAIKKANGSRAAAAPALTVACTMQDTVAIFHALADAGCTCLVFGNTKITIEAL
jgi:hypothetical protein